MILTQKLPNTYENLINNKVFNTSAVTVWAEQNYFHLQPNYSKSLIPTVLKINRKTATITQIKSEQFVTPKQANPFYFSFFVGIINLNGKRIMLLSQQVLLVCTINKRDVFRISKPIFLFYNPSDKKNMNDEQAQILLNLMMIFQQGMYFSYAYNLTEPLHHIKKLQNSQISASFNWAQSFQNQLTHCNGMWSLPVIQGFVNKIQLYINAQKLRLILISRRSIKQGGPWRYTTGLSEDGNAGNYVQTQQIFAVNDFLFSFIQVRGSVPIYWTQKFSYGMASNVVFKGTPSQNIDCFSLHITKMLINRQYENVVLLNLLNKQSSSQKKLIQNYEYIVKKTDKQKILKLTQGKIADKPTAGLYYQYYDMHANCADKAYKNFNKFIQTDLHKYLQACGFTAIRLKQDKTYQILYCQKGIMRTNCGTCIDRTNIAQSRIAAYQLVYILDHINMNINSFTKNLEFIENDEAFATLYRNLWADNGDNISQQYTGTGSTQSYAIRKGKLSYLTTIDHGLTSLFRAVRNYRQEDQQKNKTVLFLIKGFKSKKQRNHKPEYAINNINNGKQIKQSEPTTAIKNESKQNNLSANLFDGLQQNTKQKTKQNTEQKQATQNLLQL